MREREKGLEAALPAGSRVQILDQGVLTVPAGMRFIPRENALSILASTGKGPTPETTGLLVTTTAGDKWQARVEFFRRGFVAIPPGTRWDAARELARMKASEERDNPEKLRNAGFTTHVQRWLEPPRADAATATSVSGLVFITRMPNRPDHVEAGWSGCKFGREGYLQITFGGDPAIAEGRLPAMREALQGFEFHAGRRYAEANPKVDGLADDVLGLGNPLLKRC